MRPVLFWTPGFVSKALCLLLLASAGGVLVGLFRRRRRGPLDPSEIADAVGAALLSVVAAVLLAWVAQGLVGAQAADAVDGSPWMRAWQGLRSGALRAPWPPLAVQSFGACLAGGLAGGWLVFRHAGRRADIADEDLGAVFMGTVAVAFLTARWVHVAGHRTEYLDASAGTLALSRVFALYAGGLDAVGATAGGLAAAWWMSRTRTPGARSFLDAGAQAALVVGAAARLGCWLHGCDFGRPLSADAPRWLAVLGSFPRWQDGAGSEAWRLHALSGVAVPPDACVTRLRGVMVEDRCFLPDSATWSAPVHPVQLYESLAAVLLLILALQLSRRPHRAGQIAALVAMGHGLSSWWLTAFRAPETLLAVGTSSLPLARAFGGVLVLGAGAFLVWDRRTRVRSAALATARPDRPRPAG